MTGRGNIRVLALIKGFFFVGQNKIFANNYQPHVGNELETSRSQFLLRKLAKLLSNAVLNG